MSAIIMDFPSSTATVVF